MGEEFSIGGAREMEVVVRGSSTSGSLGTSEGASFESNSSTSNGTGGGFPPLASSEAWVPGS